MLMRRACALAAGAAAVAAATAPPCDLSQPAESVCHDYCVGRCGFYNRSLGETGEPRNITLIRITPANVTGIRNKNTGDAPGDVGYVLSRKNLTQKCAKDPAAFGCLLYGSNIYARFVVEIDTQFGPYLECNPTSYMPPNETRNPIWVDSSEFQCGQGCYLPTPEGCRGFGLRPVMEHNGTSAFSPDVYNCFCDGTHRESKAVGRELMPYDHVNIVGKAEWPLQCGLTFTAPSQPSQNPFAPPVPDPNNSCPVGTAYRNVTAADPTAALALACDECGIDKACAGWSTDGGTTVTLLSGDVKGQGTGCDGGIKYINKYGGSGWPINVGGYWYSTPQAGECVDVPLGTNGCTWRTVSSSYKNASCVDKLIDDAVEVHGKTCFDTCPQPLDRTGDCYLNCYRDAVIGDPAYNIAKMSADSIVGPWEKGFEEGGCPEITPLPCAGPQCGA